MVQFSIQSAKKNVELLSQELCSWWWWLWWQDEGSDFPIRMIMASQNWRLIRFLPWTPLSPFSNREPTDILQQNFVPLLIFCSSLSFICRYNQVSFDLHWEIPLLRYRLQFKSNCNAPTEYFKLLCLIVWYFKVQCFSVVTTVYMWYIALWGTCTTLWGLCSKVDKVERHNYYVCRGVRVW